jgi:hypothetical protein
MIVLAENGDQDAGRSLLDEVMIFKSNLSFRLRAIDVEASSGIGAGIDVAAFTPLHNRSAIAAARRVAVAAPPLG